MCKYLTLMFLLQEILGTHFLDFFAKIWWHKKVANLSEESHNKFSTNIVKM